MYTHKPLHCSLIQILTKFSIHRNDDQCIYSQTRSKCIRFIALLVIFSDNLVNAVETSNTRMYFWFLTFWHKIAYRVYWLMKTKIIHFLLASSILSLKEIWNKVYNVVPWQFYLQWKESWLFMFSITKQSHNVSSHSDHVKEKHYFNYRHALPQTFSTLFKHYSVIQKFFFYMN